MRVRAATAAALGPLQLTPQEFGLLNQVVTAPALTQVQLGSLLGIDRTTVVTMLDRLMAQGWIERAVDAGDRRVHRIVGTPAGADVHGRAVAAVLEVEQACLAGLDATQRAALVDALALVCAAGTGTDDSDAAAPVRARRR